MRANFNLKARSYADWEIVESFPKHLEQRNRVTKIWVKSSANKTYRGRIKRKKKHLMMRKNYYKMETKKALTRWLVALWSAVRTGMGPYNQSTL